MADNSKTANGIGLGTLIFLVFLFLKLAGMGEVANWSWWWVTSPLWIPIVFIVGFLLIVLLLKCIFSIFD